MTTAVARLAAIRPTEETQILGSQGQFDLSEIEDESVRARVALNIRRVHDSIRRTAWEIVEIGRALIDIRTSIPGQFEKLCRAEFSMDPRVARRLMEAARYVDTQLADNPQRSYLVEHLSPTVLYRLAQGDVPAQVVEQVLETAGSGKKVTPAEIRQAIEKLEMQMEAKDAELQEALGEVSAMRASLDEAVRRADYAELRAARMAEQSDKLSRNLQRSQDEITQLTTEQSALQQEVTELKKRLENPPVVEREVPKVPAGYSTIEQAIRAKEKELRDIDNQLAKAQDAMAQTQRKLAALEGDAAARQANADILSGFRADIQALCAKYPAALVAAAADQDARIAVECAEIAAHLRKLADQIETKANRRGKAA
ncbi:MAG: hypothetical protein AB1768_15955 [Pseudomonadota bacterium]|jgi:regulator of replication initiation timing